MTDDSIPGLINVGLDDDRARDAIAARWLQADPRGSRTARVFRATYDQLYDGQHTGRFRWNQLYKTEKTHFGTLLEINLRREFTDIIADGVLLDYRIVDEDIDCKYSQSMGGWMLPPECFGQLLLVATSSDESALWSLGVVRAVEANRRASSNRDGKTGLNARGRMQIQWIWLDADLPPNVLLSLGEATLTAVLSPSNGQGRVTELLRRVVGRRIGRNTIATLAQQSDYMARVRDNGHGARSILRPEGYLIPGGDYESHRNVAIRLGVEPPQSGEVVSIRVVPAESGDPWTVELDGQHWRVARPDEQVTTPAPKLPTTRRD